MGTLPPTGWDTTWAIYNPKTNCIYFTKWLFKVNYEHEVLGSV